MKITQITAKNFGLGTFEYVLGPCTLITGENRKGKTRIQRAAQLALAGYVPGIGRRNVDIYDDLGNGAPLSVCATFSDSSAVTRQYRKNGKTIACDATFHRLPDEWSVPAVLISAREYFELGSKDRINFLFSAMDLSKAEFSVDKLLADIKNITLEENTEQTQQVIREISDEIMSGYQLREHSEQSLSAWLDELSTWLENKLSEARAAVKRMDGTVKGLIEIGAQTQATPVAASVEGELKTARQTLSECEAALRTLENLERTYNQNTARKTAIETELGKPHKNGKEAKRKELETLQAEIQAYKDTEHGEAQRLLDGANAELQKLTTEKTMLEKQISDAEKEHKKTMAYTVCPCCDAPGDEWRERVQQKHDKLVATIRKRLTENGNKSGNVTAERDKRAATVAEWVEKRRKSQAASLRVGGVQREISAIENEENTIASLRRELAGLQEIQAPQSKQAATESRDRAQARVDELEQKNNQLIQERAQVAAQTQAVENAKVSLAEKAVTEKAVKIIMAAKDKLTEQTIKPLLDVANAICQPLLEQPLKYIDGEIGWTLPGASGRFQSHRTFCGAEEAIVFAALQIALAARSPIKVVMIDELGVIDLDRKLKLVCLMRDLVQEGTIDQFIGNDTSNQDYVNCLESGDVNDLTFIELK